MADISIGIDNGVSGSIGIISKDWSKYIETPMFSQQNYTKKKANITRVDWSALYDLLSPYGGLNVFVLLERPMVNPMRFNASTSALRSLESTLVIIERLKFAHAYLDSKNWQKVLLPEGIKGSDELKKASFDIGVRTFPQHADMIKKHGDADGMLIAEYCRRTR
jgi:hypothetical protein